MYHPKINCNTVTTVKNLLFVAYRCRSVRENNVVEKRFHSKSKKKTKRYAENRFFPLHLQKKRKNIMKANEQTIKQIERAIRKIAQKLPPNDESAIFTDIHIRVSQDSGELLAFDDEEQEITRCVVEQWIEDKSENFYHDVAAILRNVLHNQQQIVSNLGIIKPYSFVLEDDEKESIAELFVADDDTIIIGGDLMQGLDQDLDSFFKDLMKQ